MSEFQEFIIPGSALVGPFRPTASHHPGGDCIEVFWSNESCYGKRLTPSLYLYIGEHTQNVVGVIIEDIARLIKHDGPAPRQEG